MQPVLKDRKDLWQSLKKMLSLADLVKFAKWNAMPDENEQSLRSAYEFVRETTPEKAEEVEDPSENSLNEPQPLTSTGRECHKGEG